MAADFRPSAQSFFPGDRDRALAQYVSEASAYVHKEIAAEAQLPSWVQSRLERAATDMQLVAQYLASRRKK